MQRTVQRRLKKQQQRFDAPLAPGQSKDPYIPQKVTKGKNVENVWSIWFAARKGDLERVQLLLDREASRKTGKSSIESVDQKYRRTPLHWACRSGSPSLVKLLLERGADINALDGDGNTPLHFCCGFGTDAMLRILLNNLSLDPIVRNRHFKTAAEVWKMTSVRSIVHGLYRSFFLRYREA